MVSATVLPLLYDEQCKMLVRYIELTSEGHHNSCETCILKLISWKCHNVVILKNIKRKTIIVAKRAEED
jgi:hypothetical protein